MRLPTFDGMIPTSGPVHIVSDQGEEYMLITGGTDKPGSVDELALLCEPLFEKYLNQLPGDRFVWNCLKLNLP